MHVVVGAVQVEDEAGWCVVPATRIVLVFCFVLQRRNREEIRISTWCSRVYIYILFLHTAYLNATSAKGNSSSSSNSSKTFIVTFRKRTRRRE